MLLLNAPIPSSRVPAVAVTNVVEKGIPVSEAALCLKKVKPRKQPLVWRGGPKDARRVPRLNAANSSDYADVSDTAAMHPDVWSEENNVADLSCLVCGKSLWRDAPAMKSAVRKRTKERTIGFKETPFGSIGRQRR